MYKYSIQRENFVIKTQRAWNAYHNGRSYNPVQAKIVYQTKGFGDFMFTHEKLIEGVTLNDALKTALGMMRTKHILNAKIFNNHGVLMAFKR